MNASSIDDTLINTLTVKSRMMMNSSTSDAFRGCLEKEYFSSSKLVLFAFR